MNLNLRRLRHALIACVAMLMLAATAPVAALASGANTNPGVLPPSSEAYGKTYGAWSAAWWQYVSAQPVSSNPLSDSTGAGCRNGQSGPVFFLVGGSGSAAVIRNQCTVPAGKALFLPLINADDFEPGFTALEVWKQLEGFFGPITALHASIDGRAAGNLNPATTPYHVCAGPVARCSAPPFSITVPNENLYGVPEGTYAPTVDDGAYLLLAPLKRGAHTITFGGTAKLFAGTSNETEFSQNITYHLVVE